MSAHFSNDASAIIPAAQFPHENARFRPVLPDSDHAASNSQNEANLLTSPKMPDSARDAAGARSNSQNEANPRGRPLTPRQLTAIDLLFAGATFAAVSCELGVDAKTLYRWRHNKNFAAEVLRRYETRPARKPAGRPGALIPPPTATKQHAQHEKVHQRVQQQDFHRWMAIVNSDQPLPPPSADEPKFVTRLRKMYARHPGLRERVIAARKAGRWHPK